MAAEKVALIFGSSPAAHWEELHRLCPHPDLVIAADGGIKCARAAGYEPQLLIGDWDSGGIPEHTIPSVTLPPEKNLTDLQAAAEAALQQGITKLILAACLGGRLDQSVANLYLLEWIYEHGGHGLLWGEGNLALFWDGTPLALEQDDTYCFLSILPLDKTVSGVTLQGVKYPLEDAVLTRGDTLSISNEITAQRAVLSAKQGRMFVIRSRKFHFFDAN